MKLAAARAWGKLGHVLRRSRAPEEAPPPAVAEPAVVEPAVSEPTVSDRPATSSGGAVTARATRVRPGPRLVAAVEGRSLLRGLRYHDDYDGTLRSYDLAAPAVAVSASYRPLGGAGRFFALRAEGELAVGVSGSRASDGTELPTSASEWSGGVRAQVPIGSWRATADLAYGQHRFAIGDDMDTDLVPDVAYRWVRAAASVRVPLTEGLFMDAGGGWRHLLGMGALGSAAWFPRITGAGVEAHAGATWHARGPVSVHARADLRRYFFDVNPEVGDPYIVGGAVDQYLALILGLSLALE